MNPTLRAYLELHIAVLLFGATAILGDLIQLSAYMIVWWRVLITCISLFFLTNIIKSLRQVPLKTALQYMGIGIIVSLHWLAFYGSIKLANASIGVICMATTSLFTSFLEPLIMRQQIKWLEIIIGLLVIPGMVLVVNSTDISMQMGILVGLISAFLAALFATLNKKMIGKVDEMSITFLELGSAWLFLSILLPLYLWQQPDTLILPNRTDWVYLIILALACTTLAYVLSLRALRYLSAFAANLTVNLEPVYGIILAVILLNENQDLNTGFYLGAAVIILAVFTYPVLRLKLAK